MNTAVAIIPMETKLARIFREAKWLCRNPAFSQNAQNDKTTCIPTKAYHKLDGVSPSVTISLESCISSLNTVVSSAPSSGACAPKNCGLRFEYVKRLETIREKEASP